MRSHIVAHRATTKYFSNSFGFKTKIGKEGLPRGSTPDLGAGGLEFKSPRPDQILTAQPAAEAGFWQCCIVVQLGNNRKNSSENCTIDT